MFIIAALLSAMFESPAQRPVRWPARFEIVDTVGHLPAEKDKPAREYVIIQLPDSSLHYGLVDPQGALTDWLQNPIPKY
jgi:hypothetical protein